METTEKIKITVDATINAPVDTVWKCFTEPKHIVRWNYASHEWHSPAAENDLRPKGRFNFRMEAKDGSMGFNFTGTYTKIEPHRHIEYIMDDNRKVLVTFEHVNGAIKVTETFEAEQTNSIELQKEGWQAILNNFKKYVESTARFSKMHIEVIIEATIKKVYRTMLDPKTYTEWTSVFNPASRYEGSWAKGSKILFIGEDSEGNIGGMVSRIRENIPNKFVSIEHTGLLQGDKEITSGPEVEKWAGGLEEYSFEEMDNKTLVSVDTDVTKEFEAFFKETWPKALNKLKNICENN